MRSKRNLFETSLYRLPKMIRTGIMGPLVRPWTIPASFGRDYQALRVRKQRFGNQLLAYVWTIGIRGIDEIDVQLQPGEERPALLHDPWVVTRFPHR